MKSKKKKLLVKRSKQDRDANWRAWRKRIEDAIAEEAKKNADANRKL
jgi:hypothetical protein